MKTICYVLLALVLAKNAFGQSTEQKLSELLDVYADVHRFNGAVLVAQHGKVLLRKGYGFKNAEKHTLNSPETIFQIASITKTFTSAVVLKLVELKLLSLNDKLSKYYPDFPYGDSITIENLLTHTSGIYNYTNEHTLMQSQAFKFSSEEKMITSFKNKKPDFMPGKGWNYSNSGYSLLGYIIQKVSKMPYGVAVDHYIFKPLNMKNSGCDFIQLRSKEKSAGYSFHDSVFTIQPVIHPSVSFAAGAIYSTVDDLYRWHRGLQEGSVISSAMLGMAYTPFKNNYGYGWIIDSIYHKRTVSHSGGIHGYRTNFLRIPEEDVCIVLLNNTENTDLNIITRKILAILYEQPYKLPSRKNNVTLSEEVLRKYVGTYEIAAQGLVIEMTIENGKLIAQPVNGPRDELSAQDETHFCIKGNTDFEISFEKDSDQNLFQMIIQQTDIRRVARRIK